MGREIKFRVWHQRKMYIVDTLGFGKDGLQPSMSFAHHKSNPRIDEDDCICFNKFSKFMQFIGVQDVEGVDIYEGDWVDIIDPNGEKLDDSQCIFYSDHGGYFIDDDYDSIPIGFAIKQGYEIKVRGHMYE